MKNLLYKAFEKIDNAVMYGADKAVHAYNWTTGGTKTDLANKLLTIAPILEIGGLITLNKARGISFHSLIIPPYSFAMLFHSHTFQKRNSYMEKKEREAAEKQSLDFEVELYKKENKTIGPVCYLISSLCYISGLSFFGFSKTIKDYTYSAGLLSVGIGNSLRGSSFYIMRTRYLPPRKNCVSRGWSKAKVKLSEIVERLPKPGLASQPMPSLELSYLSLRN